MRRRAASRPPTRAPTRCSTTWSRPGFLSPEQARNASQQPLRLSAKGDDTGYPYPVDFVAELLPEFVGEQDGDLIVETTIDAGLQRVSQQALRASARRARAPSSMPAKAPWWCSIRWAA